MGCDNVKMMRCDYVNLSSFPTCCYDVTLSLPATILQHLKVIKRQPYLKYGISTTGVLFMSEHFQ